MGDITHVKELIVFVLLCFYDFGNKLFIPLVVQ